MKRILSALAMISLLIACTEEPDPVDLPVEPSTVTVGTDHVSAVSVVLKGSASLGTSEPSGLVLGFQYSTTPTILPSGSVTVEATETDGKYNFSTVLTGLEPGTTYYFRSFLRQGGRDYGGEPMEFTTKGLGSMLETGGADEIEATGARINAKLDLTDLPYRQLAFGFHWGESEEALDHTLECKDLKDNAFSATLTRLSHKTQYWYKAYLTLDGRTFTGETKALTTGVISVESVSLVQTEYLFHTLGTSLKLQATVLPKDATDPRIEWSSDNEEVAQVDENGKVKAVGNGTATITVKTLDQGKAATCAVTVAQDVTEIRLDEESLSLLEGEQMTLAATVLPSSANDKTLTWTSSDYAVADVDGGGTVTALSKGQTVITAIANDGSGVSASCHVTVYAIPDAVDLGLSVKWAAWNVGAVGPEHAGNQYAWGETESKSKYKWSTYQWCEGSEDSLIKYNEADGKTQLDPEDDVAHVKLGGSWRMPTGEEFQELLDHCMLEWTTLNGVEGMKCTSQIEGFSDRWIFLPSTGYKQPFNPADDDTTQGFYGNYWSSSRNVEKPSNALVLFIARYEDIAWDEVNFFHFVYSYSFRYSARAVRPVSE